MISTIEGPQSPGRQGADPLTVPQAMAYYKVPGVSVAVIHDFAIAAAKSWRVADAPWQGGQAATPRMLMSHTSGTGDGFGFPGYAPDEPRPTLIEILDGAAPSNTGPVRLVRP